MAFQEIQKGSLRELENRQEEILQKLEALKYRVDSMRHGLIIGTREVETCGNSSSNIEKLADELCCDVGLNPANFGPNIAAAIQQEIDSASSGDGILENALKEQSFQKMQGIGDLMPYASMDELNRIHQQIKRESIRHPDAKNSQNCLKLGTTPIGSRDGNMGNEIFDQKTLNLKNTPEAKYFLDETEKHLTKQYSQIYDGSMQGLEVSPKKYDYGVETKLGDAARAMQFADEDLIKNRIKHLEQIPKQSLEDSKEKAHLEFILKEKRSLSTEDKVILRFQNFFAKYRGLLLHSYKPETYLQRYIELAENLRQNESEGYNPPHLTTLEKDILNLMNISPTSVDQKLASSKSQKQKNIKQIAGEYHKEFKRLAKAFNDEFDILLFLPDHQLILGTEIKQAMQSQKGNKKEKTTKKAVRQTRKRKEYIERKFGGLLDQGWQYVEVIAMYDNQGSLVLDQCSDCSPFILTNGTPEEEEQQMRSLMASLTANVSVTSTKNPVAFDSFKQVFSRIIGLSGSLMSVQKLSYHHKILGTDAKDLNAGWIRASPLKFGPQGEGYGVWKEFGPPMPREGDMFGRAHDVYSVIFYSPDQIGLLNSSSKFVVFLNDYGSGKSLLCKEGAICMANQSDYKHRVYYISLLASDEFGKPKDEYFTFDEASRIDLKDTTVIVLDVHDLFLMYKQRHPEMNEEALKSVTVYDLADDLIEADPKASYFFDECPFIAYSMKFLGREMPNHKTQGRYYKYDGISVKKASSFIKNIRGKIDNESRIFLAFQVNPLCDANIAEASFETEFNKMKNELQQSGALIANLTSNLRNTKDISEVSRNVETIGIADANLKMTKNIQQVTVESTGVVSSRAPLLIPIHKKNRTKHLKAAIKRALQRAKESTNNHVIIYDERYISSKEIKESLDECAEQEDNILNHPKKSENESSERLIDYLKQPKGIYIVPLRNFIGMEANSVILIISEKEESHTLEVNSIRCNMSRAVAHLSIILEMEDEDKYQFIQSNKILFSSTEVDPSFVECFKRIKWTRFQCNSNHSKFLSTSHSTTVSLLSLEEQNLVQESPSRFLRIFAKERYVCEACIHICHNGHNERSFVSPTGRTYSSTLGVLKNLSGIVARSTKIGITGSMKCSCNEITTCQISKLDSNSLSTSQHFKVEMSQN